MVFNPKILFQKGRRQSEQFVKAIKEGKLKDDNKSFSEYQEFLKNSNPKFRRYNRSLKAYQPTIPRGKLKNSKEFEEFMMNLNEKLNTNINAKREKEREKAKHDYHLTDVALDEMESIGYDIDAYSSDSDQAKKIHIDVAIKEYNIDKSDGDIMRKISEIGRNLDRYNLRQIYDDIYMLSPEEKTRKCF